MTLKSPKGFLASKCDVGNDLADFLHSKSQLITKSYFDMVGIDLFVKILVSAKILSQGTMTRYFRLLKVREASSVYLENIY